MQHRSLEVVAGCTWFQNLRDNADQHGSLCVPGTFFFLHTWIHVSSHSTRVASEFVRFPLECVFLNFFFVHRAHAVSVGRG